MKAPLIQNTDSDTSFNKSIVRKLVSPWFSGELILSSCSSLAWSWLPIWPSRPVKQEKHFRRRMGLSHISVQRCVCCCQSISQFGPASCCVPCLSVVPNGKVLLGAHTSLFKCLLILQINDIFASLSSLTKTSPVCQLF